MDDWDNQFTLMQMMAFFDRHPLPGMEAKYRSFSFKSKAIVITTNVDPKDWFEDTWQKTTVHMNAMRRRIREFCRIIDCSGHFGAFEYDERMNMGEFEWTRNDPVNFAMTPL